MVAATPTLDDVSHATIDAPATRGTSTTDPQPRGVPRLLGATLFWLLIILITGGSLVSVLTGDVSSGETEPLCVLVVLIGAVMAVSPRRPGEALVTISFLTVAMSLINASVGQSAGFAMSFAAFWLGRRREGRALAVPLGIVLTVFVVSVLGGDSSFSFASVFAAGAVFYAGPAALGRGMRDRERLRDALQRRADAEVADRQRRVEAALLDERSRIAGELHDVVAHALSAMVVQASGARVHATRDAETAGQAFAAVERTGRDALFEIRSLLGVLRETGADDPEALEPQPTVEHLPRLVERATRAGLPTGLEIVGAERPLSRGLTLSAYRAVQDALRSARDEGGAGRADVTLRYEPTGLLVSIVDDGPGPRTALAVRERVLLYGGELRSVAADAGGHRVELRLPTERAA